MICYLVTPTEHRRVACCNQTHLMNTIDQHGFTHVAHSTVGGSHCAIYGGRAVANPSVLVVFQSAPTGVVLRDCLASLSAWFGSQGRNHAYPILRTDTKEVKCTPNGGTHRTSSDIDSWCDAQMAALTRHHILIDKQVR